MLEVTAGDIIVYVNNEKSQGQILGIWNEGTTFVRIIDCGDEIETLEIGSPPADVYEAIEEFTPVIAEYYMGIE